MRGKRHLNCYNIASSNITNLRKKEVFVFGSNIKGLHKSGAAAYAAEHFGAQWGVGEGITGQCYALPTMEGKTSFAKAVKKFISYAKSRQDRIFLVTKVGCGIAGYSVEEVAPLFSPALALENIYLPLEFYKCYKKDL